MKNKILTILIFFNFNYFRCVNKFNNKKFTKKISVENNEYSCIRSPIQRITKKALDKSILKENIFEEKNSLNLEQKTEKISVENNEYSCIRSPIQRITKKALDKSILKENIFEEKNSLNLEKKIEIINNNSQKNRSLSIFTKVLNRNFGFFVKNSTFRDKRKNFSFFTSNRSKSYSLVSFNISNNNKGRFSRFFLWTTLSGSISYNAYQFLLINDLKEKQNKIKTHGNLKPEEEVVEEQLLNLKNIEIKFSLPSAVKIDEKTTYNPGSVSFTIKK